MLKSYFKLIAKTSNDIDNLSKGYIKRTYIIQVGIPLVIGTTLLLKLLLGNALGFNPKAATIGAFLASLFIFRQISKYSWYDLFWKEMRAGFIKKAKKENKIIPFDITNGRDKERGHHVIDIKWQTNRSDTELRVQRARGSADLYGNKIDLMSGMPKPHQIGTEKGGKSFRLADHELTKAHPQNYYAWIEMPKLGEVFGEEYSDIHFVSKRHALLMGESLEVYNERKMREKAIRLLANPPKVIESPTKEIGEEMPFKQKVFDYVMPFINPEKTPTPQEIEQLIEDISREGEIAEDDHEGRELVHALVLEACEKYSSR